MAYKAKKRLYLTADKCQVVEEGSTAAAFLLAGQGSLISTEHVARYGLHDLVETYTPLPEPPPEKHGFWDHENNRPNF
jgi:hypothetical protein